MWSKVNGERSPTKNLRPPPAHGFGSMTDGKKSQCVANETSRSKFLCVKLKLKLMLKLLCII